MIDFDFLNDVAVKSAKEFISIINLSHFSLIYCNLQSIIFSGIGSFDSVKGFQCIESMSAEFFICPTTRKTKVTFLKYPNQPSMELIFKTVFFVFM